MAVVVTDGVTNAGRGDSPDTATAGKPMFEWIRARLESAALTGGIDA